MMDDTIISAEFSRVRRVVIKEGTYAGRWRGQGREWLGHLEKIIVVDLHAEPEVKELIGAALQANWAVIRRSWGDSVTVLGWGTEKVVFIPDFDTKAEQEARVVGLLAG